MRRPLLLVITVGLIVGCLIPRSFESKYTGNVPLRVQNRSEATISVYIAPEAENGNDSPWGNPIAPGQSAEFRVKPGTYRVTAMASSVGTFAVGTFNATGPGAFVVADQVISVPPYAALLQLGQPAQDTGGGAQCLPDGAEPAYASDCCSGHSEQIDCGDSTRYCKRISCCTVGKNCP